MNYVLRGRKPRQILNFLCLVIVQLAVIRPTS